MNPDHLLELIALAKTKNAIDKESGWANGAETYLDALRDEVGEVKEELYANRACYLEDELGDLLWNYLNVLQTLEDQHKIDGARVFERAREKYRRRIDGIQQGQLWADIKAEQKQKLAQEHWDKLSQSAVND